MKAKVVHSYSWPKRGAGWTVKITNGVQSFRLDVDRTKREAEWYAKMFRNALRDHDTVMRQKLTLLT